MKDLSGGDIIELGPEKVPNWRVCSARGTLTLGEGSRETTKVEFIVAEPVLSLATSSIGTPTT